MLQTKIQANFLFVTRCTETYIIHYFFYANVNLKLEIESNMDQFTDLTIHST